MPFIIPFRTFSVYSRLPQALVEELVRRLLVAVRRRPRRLGRLTGRRRPLGPARLRRPPPPALAPARGGDGGGVGEVADVAEHGGDHEVRGGVGIVVVVAKGGLFLLLLF